MVPQTALLGVRQVAKLLPEGSGLGAALTAFNPEFLAAISSNPGVLGAAVLAIADVLSCAKIQGTRRLFNAKISFFIPAIYLFFLLGLNIAPTDLQNFHSFLYNIKIAERAALCAC